MTVTTTGAARARRRAGFLCAAVLIVMCTANSFDTPSVRADAPQDEMVALPEGDMHVVVSGTPSAEAVVLIHGLAGSTAWWDQVMPALQGRYVVRVDLLGHGKSAKPDGGYSIAEQSRRVGIVLDRLGVGRAILIGHSTGGYVATSLAEQRHDLVNAIALIDTGARLDAFTDNGPASALLSLPGLGQAVWPLLPDAAIRLALSSAFTRDVVIPDEVIADVHGMTYRSLTATSSASDDYLRAQPESDRLAALALPSMVIHGSADKRWLPASFDDYRRVPGVRLETLDCGHTPMIEDPADTGPLLRDFVDHH